MASPDFDVCSEYERKSQDGSMEKKLHKIGVGWHMKTGGGISIQLEAHPIGQRIVLFPFKAKGQRSDGEDMP